MKEAIRQAKQAEVLEEVPIGCVIVHEGKIIARGYKDPVPRRAERHTQSQQEAGRLASGGMHHVCNTGTLPDVLRGTGTVQDR